jgi:hypothetical protein
VQRGALLPPFLSAPERLPNRLSCGGSKSRLREPPGEALEGPERVQEKRAERVLNTIWARSLEAGPTWRVVDGA